MYMWSRFVFTALLVSASWAFCPAPHAALSGGALMKPGKVSRICSKRDPQVTLISLRKPGIALHSSTPGAADPGRNEPLTLTAYDQLVLSVRSLTVKEIQNELRTRAVSFEDCFEKEELVGRLVEARLQIAAEALGEGDVVVDGSEGVKTVETKQQEKEPDTTPKPGPENFGSAQAATDFLKSMSPAKIQRMMSDTDLIAAIRNPNVVRMAQEVMQNPKAMDKYANDPDVLKAIQKIKDFMASE